MPAVSIFSEAFTTISFPAVITELFVLILPEPAFTRISFPAVKFPVRAISPADVWIFIPSLDAVTVPPIVIFPVVVATSTLFPPFRLLSFIFPVLLCARRLFPAVTILLFIISLAAVIFTL